MTIERMKRMWVVTPRDRLEGVLGLLAELKTVQVSELPLPRKLAEEGKAQEVDERFDRPSVETVEIDRRIARLSHVLEVMNHYFPPPRTFSQNFVSFPPIVTVAQMERAIEEIDPEEIDERVTHHADEYLALRHRMEEIELELSRLRRWMHLDGDCAIPVLKRCVAWLGTLSARMDHVLRESEKAPEIMVWRELGRGKDSRVLIQAVALKEHAEEVEGLLREVEFEPLPLPPGVSLNDMEKALRVEYAGYEERTDVLMERAREYTDANRDKVIALRGYWEAQRSVVRSRLNSVRTARMALLGGYVPARNANLLEEALRHRFAETSVILHDPDVLDEEVPVSLRNRGPFAPAQFLTEMFGLPPYGAFDPSPYITFFFLTFFGFCFGDVIYGVLLLIFSAYIARRLKKQPSTAHLFQLFVWGGVFTIVFGALTGSWAADLPVALEEYYGIGWLNRVREALMIIDPMIDPVTLLLVALAVGVISQFWGIFLAMKRDLRKGDVAGAAFDGGLWYIALPGFIMLASGLFSPPVPAWIPGAGLYVFGVGAAGLVLTQGRKQKSFAGKAVTGVISLYGIAGSYGVTSFLGDTLSYARLLALGLVTGVVGYSFNLVAGMMKDVPYIGTFLFILIALMGHTLNFLLAVLGGFVHSARLIFLEVFGRFYESGGRPFRPLGEVESVQVTEESAS